ncbi:helix-turn-helix transcriptional regulator [Nonomuraea typhae]|uniref:helix-turn-helix transcriptional regulator n=1 Tax=Nonomuraea typhae TaxID=2603600 RepID=UPI001FEB09F1|nr:MarR family transcriptional regulator [Nonomuraea typhae]
MHPVNHHRPDASDPLGLSHRFELPRWTFLTHHARVLLEIARNPEVRLRDLAAGIGVTERTVQNIVNDLHAAGYLSRERVGRHNHYTLNADQHFRYPTEAGLPVRRLIDMFADRDIDGSPSAASPQRESPGPPPGG